MPSPPGFHSQVTVHSLAAASHTDDFYPSVSLWPPLISWCQLYGKRTFFITVATYDFTTATSLVRRLNECKWFSSDKTLMSREMAPLGWPNTTPNQYHTGFPLYNPSSPSLLPLPGWCLQHPFCLCFNWEVEWEQVAGGWWDGRGEEGANWQPAVLTHEMLETAVLLRKVDTGKSDGTFFLSFFFFSSEV